MGAYVVVLLASVWFLRSAPGSSWRIPVALAPVVPIVFAIWGQVRSVREKDELEQKIAAEGSMLAQRTFTIGCITYGFLQAVGFPAVNAVWVACALVLFTMAGRRIVRWKYR